MIEKIYSGASYLFKFEAIESGVRRHVDDLQTGHLGFGIVFLGTNAAQMHQINEQMNLMHRKSRQIEKKFPRVLLIWFSL